MHNQERTDLSCSSEKSLKRKSPLGQRVQKYEGAARQLARMCSISGCREAARATNEDGGMEEASSTEEKGRGHICAYRRVKGPTWRGALSLGEEQELVVNREEEDGEDE